MKIPQFHCTIRVVALIVIKIEGRRLRRAAFSWTSLNSWKPVICSTKPTGPCWELERVHSAPLLCSETDSELLRYELVTAFAFYCERLAQESVLGTKGRASLQTSACGLRLLDKLIRQMLTL